MPADRPLSDDWEGLVVVSRYVHPLDARMLADLDKMRLEEAGIQAVVLDSVISTLLPYETIAFGGVKVAVKPEDSAAARQVLELPAEKQEGCPRVRPSRRVFVWLIWTGFVAQIAIALAVAWTGGWKDVADALAMAAGVAIITLLLIRKARQIEKQKEKTR